MESITEEFPGGIAARDLQFRAGARASRTILCNIEGGVRVYVDVDDDGEAVAISLVGKAPLDGLREQELHELAKGLARLDARSKA